MYLQFLVIYLLVSPSLCRFNESYSEELFIKPLPSGHVYTYFQFTNQWNFETDDELQHTNLMPLSIAYLLKDFDIKELHISLTQGLWRYQTWGYPVIDSPPGAEVWAWFASSNLTKYEVDRQWKYLTNTLSGLLCSSLNFIDKQNTIEPKFSFRPQFSMQEKSGSSPNRQKFIRYSTLPREIVCTENLTPWKKLLPCNSKVGFASLLNSGSIHNTHYHSLKLSIRTLCDKEKISPGCVIEFKQTASLVYEPKLLDAKNTFSIRRMFGQGLNGICTLAKSSKIYVDVTDDKYELSEQPDRVFASTRGGSTVQIAEYDIEKQSPYSLFNIAWELKKNSNVVPIIPLPPLTAHRYILGHGQERGVIATQVTNSHWSSLNVIFMENIPWFVPTYLHTLKIKSEKTGNEIIPRHISYLPGVQREKAYQLELAFTIPAQDVIEISFEFDYIFLKWFEYPPDANHGHYLGSAVLSTTLPIAKNYTAIPIDGNLFVTSFNASRSSYFLQIHTETLVVLLPTPDFSMPYNVICLACTVVALAFGPIHNVTTKGIVVEKPKTKPSILDKIISKIFKSKPTNEEGDDNEEIDKSDSNTTKKDESESKKSK